MNIHSKTLKTYSQNQQSVIAIATIIAIIAKLVEHLFLPDKYYYDNSRICQMVNDINYKKKWPGSYETCADFFRKINIFGFDNMLQWSIFLGFVFNICVIIILYKNKGMDTLQTIFAMMYVGILNIYIFNIGKDAMQILIFLILFVIISTSLPALLKVLCCFGVLYWESTFFRSYYIIMAFFFLAVFALLKIIQTSKKRLSVVKIILVIALIYAIVFSFMSIAKVAMPDDYHEVLVCKDNPTKLNANSTIDNKIDYGENTLLYMGNYIINSVRMAFPIELLKEGVFYVPFVVFEIFFLYYLVKSLKRLYSMDDKQLIAISIFLAYFMGSVLFEPDFGSFVRHEAATFPVAYFFIFTPENWTDKEAVNEYMEMMEEEKQNTMLEADL